MSVIFLSILMIAILAVAGCGDDRVATPDTGGDTGGTGGTGDTGGDIPIDPALQAFVDGFALDPDGLALNPETTVRGGFRGFSYVKDQWPWGRVPNVRVLFVSEDHRRAYAFRTDENGDYRLPLPPARYRVYALADGYEPFSTCCGFYVRQGEDWQVGNIPLSPEGSVCGPDGTYAGTPGYDPEAATDRAPTASITADREVAAIGEPVTLRISGADDHDLVWLWWGSLLGCEPDCGRANFVDCGGADTCSTEVVIAFATPGRHVLFANARDDLYGNGEPHQASEGLGMGCVEIVVTR